MKKIIRMLPDVIKALVVMASMLLLLTSCSCERRLELLKKHCPECFHTQTVHLIDTLVPEPVHILQHIPWSTFNWHIPLVLEQPQYTLVINTDDEGLTIDAEVRPDTIIITRDVPVEVPSEKDKSDSWPWAAAVAVSMVALWGIVHRFTRRREN